MYVTSDFVNAETYKPKKLNSDLLISKNENAFKVSKDINNDRNSIIKNQGNRINNLRKKYIFDKKDCMNLEE